MFIAVKEWKFGAEAAAIAIDAQELRLIRWPDSWPPSEGQCQVVRFPRAAVPAAMMQYLDSTTPAMKQPRLSLVARTDADMTNSRCSDAADREGELVSDLFDSMPEIISDEGKLMFDCTKDVVCYHNDSNASPG